jgi:hypothetical protein
MSAAHAPSTKEDTGTDRPIRAGVFWRESWL